MIKGLAGATLTWLQSHLDTRENRRVFEEERLVVEVTESLMRTMADRGLSQADLARALETSRSNVSQLLNGRRNLTLRTLARLAFELGQRVDVSMKSMTDHGMQPIEMEDPVIYWSPEFTRHTQEQMEFDVDISTETVSDDCLGNTGEFSFAA